MSNDDVAIFLLYVGAKIREVFPGSGRVTGIQVDNNSITLPGEIFEDITESGIQHSCLLSKVIGFLKYLLHLTILRTSLIYCLRELDSKL